MITLKIQRANGAEITLTGRETEFQVIDIEGLNPPKAQVNITSLAGFDGGKFNSAKLETRPIVITIKINGDAEANRLFLYDVFRPKELIRMFYKNDRRDIYADGIVDSVECTAFTNAELAQVSITCPDPYLKSVEEIISDVTDTLSLFHFPFFINTNEPIPFSTYSNNETVNVYNDSDAGTGVNIEIDFTGAVAKLELKNTTTGEGLTLVDSFIADDRVFINTNQGHKSIRRLRNGVSTNIFSKLQKGSIFFGLVPGDNEIDFRADNGSSNEDVYILFRFHKKYMGV